MRRNRRSYSVFITVAVVIFVTVLVTQAQTPTPSPTPSSSPSLEREFVKNLLHDQKAIWMAPFRLKREDIKWVGPSSVGLMALFTTDRITGDAIAESQRQVGISRAISRLGSKYTLVGAAGTFYLVGRYKHNYKARETGVLSAEALLDSVMVVATLKGVTQRARPLAGVERSEFFDGGSSFPSGHSTEAWAVATVIANEYHDRPMVQFAAYGIASAVSVARFTGQKHYISDVLAGSALGYAIGRYVYRTHHREYRSSFSDAPETEVGKLFSIAPKLNRKAKQYGVTLTWSF